MIYFDAGWDSTAIGTSARRGDRAASRLAIAARCSKKTAESIINKAADVGEKSGESNFTVYFADLVKRQDRVMIVEKGLHQEEGTIFDADTHLTLRKGFKDGDTVRTVRAPAYHLYVKVVDPPLGKASYTLEPKKLTVQHGANSSSLDLSSLGSFASP